MEYFLYPQPMRGTTTVDISAMKVLFDQMVWDVAVADMSIQSRYLSD